jgi:hypothetical protein
MPDGRIFVLFLEQFAFGVYCNADVMLVILPDVFYGGDAPLAIILQFIEVTVFVMLG